MKLLWQRRKKKKSEAQPFLIAVGITLGIGIIIFAILMATVFRGSFSKKDDTDQSSLNASVTESTSTETIVVPDFKNLSYEAISKNPVWDGKFTFKTKYEYSDTVKEGYVISQSLPEQTTVAIGSEIELVISSGKESVDVPDVFGKSYAEAKQMLTDSGFVCTVAGNYTEGVVVSMSVEPGSKAPKGHAAIGTYILDLERERRDELESELRRRFDTRPPARPVNIA